MAVAALVVSIVAVLIAGVAALFTKRQADYAKQLVAFDKERRHEEGTPQLAVREVPTSERRGWPSMEVENLGPGDLDEVVVALLAPPAGEDPVGSLVDTRDGSGTDLVSLGALSLGGAAVVRVRLENHDTRGELARLRIECRVGEERWALRKECTFRRPGRLIN
jgi:hypothetical protein